MLAVLIVPIFAFAACGESSSDESQIEDVIESSGRSADPADCTKLMTRHLMEQVAQESGPDAERECKEEAENEEGFESVDISNIAVDGSRATAAVRMTGGGLDDGQTIELELVKDDGQWKMNEILRFVRLDKRRLVEGIEEESARPTSGFSPGFAACFAKAFEESSQEQIEIMLLSGTTDAIEEVAESCSYAD